MVIGIANYILFKSILAFLASFGKINIVFDKSENDLTFGDNVIARFGDTNDLSIVHNGTNSTITNGTGALLCRGNDIRLQNAGGSEVMLDANADGAVNLYHNNNKKLVTATSSY